MLKLYTKFFVSRIEKAEKAVIVIVYFFKTVLNIFINKLIKLIKWMFS